MHMVLKTQLEMAGSSVKFINKFNFPHNFNWPFYTPQLKGARFDCFRFFSNNLKNLVSEESSYFSHYPCRILQMKTVPFEGMNENVTSYGNHN